MENKRTVIAVLTVDDDKAIEADKGTLEYFEGVIQSLYFDGITLEEARILDSDDLEDAQAIAYAEAIFKDEV